MNEMGLICLSLMGAEIGERPGTFFTPCIESEAFSSVVEDRDILSPLAEAVLLSPRVDEAVQANCTRLRFEVGSDVLASDFEVFLGFVRNRDSVSDRRGAVLKSLFISGRLGKDRLNYASLASLHSISVFDSSVRNLVAFCDLSVDFSASRCRGPYSLE
jgi:hypothetical protein